MLGGFQADDLLVRILRRTAGSFQLALEPNDSPADHLWRLTGQPHARGTCPMVSRRAPCLTRRSKRNGPAINGWLRPSHCHCSVLSVSNFKLSEPDDLNAGSEKAQLATHSAVPEADCIDLSCRFRAARRYSPLDNHSTILLTADSASWKPPCHMATRSLQSVSNSSVSDKVLNRGTVLGWKSAAVRESRLQGMP